MKRILLAEDHALVRTGLCLMVESLPDMMVVAEAAGGLEALKLIEEHRPDAVMMDLSMPGIGGIEATRRSRERFPEIPILIVSMHADEAYVQQAFVAGASGYLLKGADKSELEAALRAVLAGDTYITGAVSKSLIKSLACKQSPTDVTSMLGALTIRQQEVLRLVAEGNSTKEIAAKLGLSVKTVEAHRSAIMERLGIRDLAGIVRFAVRAGLVAPDK
jgi:DNA-binding NarL/FixJ family response regulator